jgi:hypothetical protein
MSTSIMRSKRCSRLPIASNRQSYEPVRRVLHNAIKALELRFNRKQAVTGVPTDYAQVR